MLKGTHNAKLKLVIFCGVLTAILSGTAQPAQMPKASRYTNSIGMEFVRIQPGQFQMGFGDEPLLPELTEQRGTNTLGDYDEHPTHTVKITYPFYMAAFEVTNYQYELFDPEHKKLRGRRGVSTADDDAVVFVNWYQAQAFCRWLSDKEGLPYRLPTEAEWEYACRAGTTTAFYTGRLLPDSFTKEGKFQLKVGQTPPNPWGLYDMHGNVEEWCYDWYGPYQAGEQIDPIGYIAGSFRVTRGGSHSTGPYYLRSSNRMGTIPEDKNSLIGFRVVLAAMPKTRPLPEPAPQPYQVGVKQRIPRDLERGPDPEKPYFYGPRKFIIMPPDNRGPLYNRHNHFISVVECPNGDLLAIWHTCITESGRELAIAASRLRYGKDLWEPASLFWDAPDRNDHGHALWFDGDKTIYHFQGLADTVRNVALVMRTSTDNGVTWSLPHIIADHGKSTMPVESVFRTKDGFYVISCDKGPNVIWVSKNKGLSWFNPGGIIRGKHAAVVELNDGRLLALGRESNIDGKMPQSISDDMGKTWTYSPSCFQPVSWGQRAVLLRLKEGPLFFASFCKRMPVKDASGGQHLVSGLFAAVSTDEGKTWPYRRLVSDDGPAHEIETMDGYPVTMDQYRSEAAGYLSVCQTADGVIHLLSSRQHYAFNLKWILTPPPATISPEPPEPQAMQLPTKALLPYIYKPKDEIETNQSLTEIDIPSRQGGSMTKVLKLTGGMGRGFFIRSNLSEPFTKVQPTTGFTAEIKTRLIKSLPGERGVDLELYDGGAARYAITITSTGVYWYEGLVVGTALLAFDQFTPVAQGLDNTDAMHTYRLAVRPDRIVQIYRDGELIGVRRYEYRTPRDAYIQFGAGKGTEALIEYVRYDLGGPYQP